MPRPRTRSRVIRDPAPNTSALDLYRKARHITSQVIGPLACQRRSLLIVLPIVLPIKGQGALRGAPAEGGVLATAAPVRGKAFPLNGSGSFGHRRSDRA
jgi:hypothetical protein